MLPYYAERFPTVEINYTFYRMPNEKMLAGWSEAHARALQADAEGAEADHARRAAERLRRARAAVPRDGGDARPEARRAAVPAAAQLQEGPRALRRVSRRLPAAARCAAFEFRHASWLDDGGVRPAARAQPRALRRRQREADDARSRSRPTTPTSGCATRATRRRTSRAGRDVIREQTSACRDVFVYFKHEEEGKGRSSRTAADRRAGIGPSFRRALRDGAANLTISRSAQ